MSNKKMELNQTQNGLVLDSSCDYQSKSFLQFLTLWRKIPVTILYEKPKLSKSQHQVFPLNSSSEHD